MKMKLRIRFLGPILALGMLASMVNGEAEWDKSTLSKRLPLATSDEMARKVMAELGYECVRDATLPGTTSLPLCPYEWDEGAAALGLRIPYGNQAWKKGDELVELRFCSSNDGRFILFGIEVMRRKSANKTVKEPAPKASNDSADTKPKRKSR